MQNIPIGVSIIKFKIKDNISFMKEMNCKLVMKMQKIYSWRMKTRNWIHLKYII